MFNQGHAHSILCIFELFGLIFIYMVVGAILLKLFLILIRKLQSVKFFKYFTDRFLIKEQINHPNMTIIIWSTVFWPLLICMYIVAIPIMAFILIIEKAFNKTEEIEDIDDEIDRIIKEEISKNG